MMYRILQMALISLVLGAGLAQAKSTSEETSSLDSFVACQYRTESEGEIKRMVLDTDKLESCPEEIRQDREDGGVEVYRLAFSTRNIEDHSR